MATCHWLFRTETTAEIWISGLDAKRFKIKIQPKSFDDAFKEISKMEQASLSGEDRKGWVAGDFPRGGWVARTFLSQFDAKATRQIILGPTDSPEEKEGNLAKAFALLKRVDE